MKFWRTAIILLAVVALLIAGYIIVQKRPAKTDSTAGTSTTSEADKLVNVDSEKISEIKIDNKAGKFVFTKKDKDYILTLPVIAKVSADAITNCTSSVFPIYSDKTIEKNAASLSQYGLDNPQAVVTVTTSDKKIVELEIGSQTPTKDDYYIMEKGSNNVYTALTYNIDKFVTLTKNDLLDKTLFTIKPEDIRTLTMESGGKLYFSAKLNDLGTGWNLTAPFEADANVDSIGAINTALSQIAVQQYVEENASDLDKYGLKTPAYSFEFATASSKFKLLLGDENPKNSERYAKLSDSSNVFLINGSSFTFLDKPLKEIISVFAYLPNIWSINKLTIEMDGKTINCDVQAPKDSTDTAVVEKYTVDGKDVTGLMNAENDSLFKKLYQGIVGITLDDIELGTPPLGKAEITFTYALKSAPGTMKVEFIPKDNDYYYVVRNGKFANITVAKKKFDEPDGPRAAYKNLLDVMNAKK
jgi:hypothetical protein